MKKFKKFLRIIELILSYIFFPVIILVFTALVHEIYPGFWTEFIACTAITASMTLIANKGITRLSDDQAILRCIFVIITGAVIWADLAGTYSGVFYFDTNCNPVTPVVIVIALSVILIASIFTMYSRISTRDYPNGRSYSIGIAKLTAAVFIVFELVQVYRHFGTWFILIPIISFVPFILFLFFIDHINDYVTSEEGLPVLTTAAISPIAILVISVLYQFWYHPIVFGWALWKIFTPCVGMLIIYLIYDYITSTNRKKELAKVQAEQAAYEASEKAKKETERLKNVEMAIGVIKQGDSVRWKEILLVCRYYSYNLDRLSEILPYIHLAQLSELVEISTKKEQIAWTQQLDEALEIISKIYLKSYNDKQLHNLTVQVCDFAELIKKHSSFKGSANLIGMIKSKFPEMKHLIELH